ncbi:hypothetical protein SPBR_01986 [Sporothrix brasiliensis 5110]|uniref:DUF8021 domain-containing protein n=1 Tax=Sporothrix brasiliensis 5110 TaxID=1398154 RepID=A0A0C2IWN0_9PEZI|nr:uncharacterized protein SPBR_01986 [Sporothrix brasiliensis 5110]KIH91130.1 hypothetical protein SPBR_01986 [Sporothrix brasiliensis 5110]
MVSFHLLGLTLAALAGQAVADCSRDTLQAAADAYLAAQEAGAIAGSAFQKLLDPAVTYRQNNKASSASAGIWSKALKLDHNRTTLDTTQCASYTELVSTAGPYVVGVQLRHASASDAASPINAVDAIVATTGDWAFNAAKTLSYIATEDWGTLAAADRSPRAVLQAAADAYLDMWSNSTAINAVPWGSPCARTEGSMHFSPSCTVGVPTSGSASAKITQRRYVIDETVGSADVFCSFAGALPDSHEFRLIGGKVRLVHTITV